MPVSVNFYWVVLALICVLALLSVISHFAVRRHVGLVWLAAALVSGGINTILFSSGGTGLFAFLWLAVFDTFALYAVAQAIRLVIGAGATGRRVVALSLALTTCSIMLMLAGIGSVVVQCIPFQMAGLLLVADALVAAFRSRRNLPEIGIAAGMTLHVSTHIARIPFFPSLLDAGQAYPSLASPWLNWLLLTSSSVYVPLVVVSIIARDLIGHIDTFRETSKRDGLTGLLTRIAFEHEATRSSPRFGALVVCDLDHFKTINDTFGHPAGDEALKVFGRLCGGAAPIAGRTGGEEFALLLPGATIVQAQATAERLRRSYTASAPPELASATLTASFGIAAYGGVEQFRETMVKADRALYRAKRQGRDCVVLHGSSAGEQANPILRTA